MRLGILHRGVALLMFLVLSFALVLSRQHTASQPIPTGYAAGGASEQPAFSCPVKASDGFGVTACYMSELYNQWARGSDHYGMDIGNGVCGGTVRAMENGTATFLTGQGNYGTLVTITYDNGWTSKYAHMQDFAGFSIGTHNVKKGDPVGHVGGECHNCADDEGNPFKWACHLHYELYDPDGRRVDPWTESCWDVPIRAGQEGYCTRAQMNHYNPGAAAPELDSPDVPGVPVSEVGPSSIVPLAAKLVPNTYSFNPSFRVKLNYTLDEYETLFDFARSTTGCQENHPNGVNPCVRALMAAGAEGGITFKTGNCTHEMAMPNVGFGTYEVCALSQSVFPLAEAGMALGSYAASYRFALMLEDRTAPPAVGGLRAELVSEPGEQDRYRISWNAPSAEDIESYSVVWPGGSSQTAQTSVEITMTAGTAGSVTVTPRDYAGNSGQSDSISVP